MQQEVVTWNKKPASWNTGEQMMIRHQSPRRAEELEKETQPLCCFLKEDPHFIQLQKSQTNMHREQEPGSATRICSVFVGPPEPTYSLHLGLWRDSQRLCGRILLCTLTPAGYFCVDAATRKT